MKVTVIIPARFNSTRLPGKPLAIIGDKPMIQHTWERACQSNADEVVIATDSLLISEVANNFGAKVIATSRWCETGTERIIEASKLIDSDIIINVQGDEPFINPLDINLIIKLVKSNLNSVATLRTDLIENEAMDPNAVKILTNDVGVAVMFTRSSLYDKTNFARKHIGIYGYSIETLNRISKLKPTENSINNSLEQLTWMDNGIQIVSGYTEHKSFGIDTQEDLERANKYFNQ
jgi:3-deoxy-manno-octulosonate cytidylyltransferase (CMP-KDO synthetase)